jgi:uncharacterized protein (TIGR01777 family)
MSLSVLSALAVLRHRRPAEWVRNPIVPGAKSSPRNVLISGATGFVGGHLVRALIASGDSVTVFTRDSEHALDRFGPHVRIVTDLHDIGTDAHIDAIVNLAGARILGIPWTRRRRHTLMDSRVRTTQSLVDLCTRLEKTPRVFISASAIGYYGVRGEEEIDEQAKPQPIFQSELCQRWEQAASGAEAFVPQVVKLRLGLVFGRDGGALPSLAMPVRLGLGTVLGSGKQWVSWIHIEDLVRLMEFVLESSSLRGAMNAVSPNPATHRQVQQALGRALQRPIWMRVPAFVVRIALGEMAQLLVDGQRVLPARVLAAGFEFRHPELGAALNDLVGPLSRTANASTRRRDVNTGSRPGT